MSWRDCIKIHPACEAFPEISGEELNALAADIKANGLRQKVIVCQGELLDGRSRLDAMEQVGLRVLKDGENRLGGHVAREVETDDPWAYSVSLNLVRRHLTDSQRAVVAAKMANQPAGGQIDGAITVPKAAELVNVSLNHARMAKAVMAKNGRDGELIGKVERGEMKVGQAYREVYPPKADVGVSAPASTRTGDLHHLDKVYPDKNPQTPITRIRDFIDRLNAEPRELASITQAQRVELAREFCEALGIVPRKVDQSLTGDSMLAN